MNNDQFTIVTFYQFKSISNLEKIEKILKNFCFFNKIRGSILLAKEGINGTIAGFDNSIKAFEKEIANLGFSNIESKKSLYKYMPFNRLKIKIKKEIVTFDGKNYNVEKKTANYIKSKKWNTLIKEKDTLVIDVRNDFEHEIGTFNNAINPKTKSFSQFKNYIQKSLNKFKEKKIALFVLEALDVRKLLLI